MNKTRRLLIVGARGFLGTFAFEAATKHNTFEVIRGDRNSAGTGTVEIDIADSSSVARAFSETRPHAVLLLAAMSDIDRCESLPEQAYAINARGAEYVANECAHLDARLLFISTAAVFDGMKHGYHEDDAPAPVSTYGKTKALAESAVRASTPSAVVIRIALALGFARKPGTNALLDKLIQKWKAGETISLSTQEQRNPIDAATLSRIMIDMLADEDVSGVFHVGALDSISRYELGKRLAMRANVSLDLVRAWDTPVPGRAPRGMEHFLLTDKIRGTYELELGTCDQVIERCFLWHYREQSTN